MTIKEKFKQARKFMTEGNKFEAQKIIYEIKKQLNNEDEINLVEFTHNTKQILMKQSKMNKDINDNLN